jgi:hypothetical protein
MATLKGLIDFEGKMGGMNAYMLNGIRVLRQNRKSDKNKIATGKNYQRTRENNTEFGGAVAAAKVLRQSLMPVIRPFVDSTITGRLQGKYRDMINVALGIRGQRGFKPLKHVESILAIPLNEHWHLDTVLRVKPVIEVNMKRNAATLSLFINPTTDLFVPIGASHFECIYAIAIQPSFEYDIHTKKYACMDGLDQLNMTHTSSHLFPIDKNKTINVSLTVPPIIETTLHADSALVSVLGIRFHQQIGFKTYPLETGKAMGFVGVH